jgi:phosphoribosylanthranilate isomerase
LPQLFEIATEKLKYVVRLLFAHVKGVTNLDDATFAGEAGCDFIGLIFAKSPRQITIETAKQISNELHRNNLAVLDVPMSATFADSRRIMDAFLKTNGPLLIGVFSNDSFQEINRIVKACRLDLVQLHGDETPQFARLISVPVIKAIHIMEDDSANSVLEKIRKYEGSANYILLDTGIKGAKHQGGSGKSFDWNIVTSIQSKYPIILAGGLSSSNIEEAMAYNPWCLDVSSGIELSKGKKDLKKMESFIKAVKSE